MLALNLLGVVEATLQTALENRLKVEFLAQVCHINDAVALELLRTVPYRSHISGVVVVPTIRLLDHQRNLLSVEENADGSITLNCQFLLNKFVDHGLQEGVVEALAHLFHVDV